MKSRDIALGLIALVVLIAIGLWIKKVRDNKQLKLIETTPTIEEKISDRFKNFQTPDDTRKIELKDVGGGDGFGVASSEAVLADLPDLQPGKYYQVWVDDKFLGDMRVAKGGFLYEGDIKGKKVSIKLGGKVILEGSF